jgi:hypothetical protein
MVGDTITLPSGIVVKATSIADRTRPWTAMRVGRQWHVVRDGKSPGKEHYFAGTVVPLQLDEVDAMAAAMILNTVQS